MRKALQVHAVHLLNDFSGSPLVFSLALKQRIKQGESVVLYTSAGPGFLDGISGADVKPMPYRWSPSGFKTLMAFMYAQFWLFFRLLFTVKRGDIVYVNTLLPFAALIAGKLKGAQTIQHLHEVSVKPAVLMRFLVFISEHFADEQIFVSAYLKGCFNFKRPKQVVVHNVLPEEFIEQAAQCKGLERMNPNYRVLMLCSLKAYKGVYVMAELARSLPRVQFDLVLNASESERTQYVNEIAPGSNLHLHPPTPDTHRFYRRADMVVNLSLPDQWIETFGMTLLEARAYGLPVIAPPVGGPAEIVVPGQHGWLISAYNTEELVQVIAREAERKAMQFQDSSTYEFVNQ